MDVTVPVQCQVTDSRLFIIESIKVREPESSGGGGGVMVKVTVLLLIGRESYVG